MKPLDECINETETLIPEGMSDLPTKLIVQRIDYLAGRFSGARTLVDDVENAFKEFYENVGQHLRRWTPPPPKCRKQQGEEKEKAEEKQDKHEQPEAQASQEIDAPQPNIAPDSVMEVVDDGDGTASVSEQSQMGSAQNR